jgi:hypothetical protein
VHDKVLDPRSSNLTRDALGLLGPAGGPTYHGKVLWGCNRWLRWALIEGAWVSVGCSAYFGSFYKRQRQRGKTANTAITIVARRMCRIIYQLLTQHWSRSSAPGRRKSTNVPDRESG